MLRLAVNRSGPVEVELIQVLEGDTAHSEHLRAHGEGLHHVRFRVDKLEPKLAQLEAAGYRTVLQQTLRPDARVRLSRDRRRSRRSLIELFQMP